MFDWAYRGVNFDLAGNGGEECRDFISVYQRITESILATVFAGYIVYNAVSQLTLPQTLCPTDRVDRCGKRILLVVMCLTFGIELGFKFATKQMIYILNPCHLATMIQIFCLAAPPSRLVTAVFRLHLHMLTGAPIAIVFPVVNTRLVFGLHLLIVFRNKMGGDGGLPPNVHSTAQVMYRWCHGCITCVLYVLPFEIEVYYIQHILMLIIPLYLLRIGGVYTAEPITDLSWSCVSLGILYIYHFLPLQYLAFVSLVNLNNMLCPAVSDPFYGPWYRIFAVFHQALSVPLLGKLFVWFSLKIGLRKQTHIEEKHIFWGQKTHLGVNSSQECDRDATDSQSWKFNNKNGICNVASSHDNNAKNGHVKSS